MTTTNTPAADSARSDWTPRIKDMTPDQKARWELRTQAKDGDMKAASELARWIREWEGEWTYEHTVTVDALEVARAFHEDHLWDSIRLPLMDLFFGGEVNTRQVKAAEAIFRAGFARVAGLTPEAWDQVTVSTASNMGHFIEIGRTLMVVFRFNRKDWEGTLAGLTCGASGSFMIGHRGGIQAQDWKQGEKGKAEKSPLIYGWRS